MAEESSWDDVCAWSNGNDKENLVDGTIAELNHLGSANSSHHASGWDTVLASKVDDVSNLENAKEIGDSMALNLLSPPHVAETKPKRGRPRLMSLVTRVAATSKSQIASDCNRNFKITATQKTPSEANFLDSGSTSFAWFLLCFRSVTQVKKPPKIVATTGV